MFHYKSIVDHQIVELIFDQDEYFLIVTLKNKPELVTNEIYSKNAKMISSELCAAVGTGPAAAFLHTHNVDQNSDLWFLNHTGYLPMTQEKINKYVERIEK